MKTIQLGKFGSVNIEATGRAVQALDLSVGHFIQAPIYRASAPTFDDGYKSPWWLEFCVVEGRVRGTGQFSGQIDKYTEYEGRILKALQAALKPKTNPSGVVATKECLENLLVELEAWAVLRETDAFDAAVDENGLAFFVAFCAAIREIDAGLTTKTTLRGEDDTELAERVLGGRTAIVYLSDGGYSRLIVGGLRGRPFIRIDFGMPSVDSTRARWAALGYTGDAVVPPFSP